MHYQNMTKEELLFLIDNRDQIITDLKFNIDRLTKQEKLLFTHNELKNKNISELSDELLGLYREFHLYRNAMESI